MTNGKAGKSFDAGVGYGKPPTEHRFKAGISGNPRGRPKGAIGRKAIVRRVLMEKHRADPLRTGRPKKYTVIELALILLKQLAASGDRRAFKAFNDLDKQFGRTEFDKPVGLIILPERLTEEEWEEMYSPKDDLPGDETWD